MTNTLMDRVSSLASEIGAQRVGVAPISRFSHAPKVYQPQSFLPDAKNVIVVGVHYPDACVEHCGGDDLQAMNAYGIVQVDMNVLLDILSFRIARLLDREGHNAVSFSTSHIWLYRTRPGVDRSFMPDFPHRHAAVAAGLGEFGWNGLVLNKDFGPRVRFNTIITSAELPATPMYDGPALCDKCMRCVKYCPMDTFRKETSGMDHVRIGDREFAFPLTNKWRCGWAEHFAITENTEIPDVINEQSVQEARSRLGVYGGEMGNCLRQCLPAAMRVLPAKAPSNIWPRKKPVPPGDIDELARRLQSRIGPKADYLAVLPLDSLPADLATQELPGTQSLVLVGLNLPAGLPDVEVLQHGGDLFRSLQENAAFCREEGRRLLGLIGHEVAMIAEEHGYDGMPRVTVSGERVAALCGFGGFGGDGRIFRTTAFGTNSMFTVIALTAPLAQQIMTPRARNASPCSREQIEALARKMGADLFGVTPLDRLAHFDAVKRMRQLYPTLRNAIVLGMHYPNGYLDGGADAAIGALGSYSFAQYQTHRELGWAALALCARLGDAGHVAIPSLDLCETGSKVLNVRGTPTPDAAMDRGMIGLLPFAFIPDNRCNVFAATAAGLATIGYNGSALTPEYGARQRFICVLTDLELPADALSDFDPKCSECRRCLSACPTGALNADEPSEFQVGGRTVKVAKLNSLRCDWAKRFGLTGQEGPALLGSTTDIQPPKAISMSDITAAMEKRDHLQDHFVSIIEPCIKVCPARGRSRTY